MKSDWQNQTTVALSPEGSLYLLPESTTELPSAIVDAFQQSPAQGVLHLGLSELEATLPVDLGFWRDLGRLYFSKICAIPGLSEVKNLESIGMPLISYDETAQFIASAPPLIGGEYLSSDGVKKLWAKLHAAFGEILEASRESVGSFFAARNVPWNLVGRVCFHLVENKIDENAPFAFMATYTHQLSNQGKAQHLPLGRALQEYAGERNKTQLLQLLLPVQKGSQKSDFLKALVENGEIYHPLAWTPADAYQFLKDIPVFESSGIVVRVPNWWNSKNPRRAKVSLTVGGRSASVLGVSSLLNFSVGVTLGGEQLTEAEYETILKATSGLALIRGQWVEIDRDKLSQVLAHWKRIERSVKNEDGMSFIDGMRLLAGASFGSARGDAEGDDNHEWVQVQASEKLSELLEQLRDPDGNDKDSAQFDHLPIKATLRPYQKTGVRWLWLLNRLQLGGCLADDMGLGKTIQVIALLLLIKQAKKERQPPSLLVVPASLIANWKSELERFAPTLTFSIAHPSAGVSSGLSSGAFAASADKTRSLLGDFEAADLVITTYGYLIRLPQLIETQWNCVVIDEAQAIKNSGSRQTRAVKSLKGSQKIALTGTPVENRLSDLWSLFDFLTPGLLGNGSQFGQFVKRAEKDVTHTGYGALKNLVKPYLLRRLKTDKTIISDLPDKTEVSAYCQLSKVQTALYQQSVTELAEKIVKVQGIQRRGLVLSFLMRFKQICNHPSQWLADGRYDAADSGKFSRLGELAEEIAAKQEKVLVFTQFREMTDSLAKFLETIFGRPGLILHGNTPVKKRKELVDAFQDERGPPFFVLSLKAGGTGLNLTAASHVIHFDRWWNPAVENQATDRAFRIGQKKNVLVHKFVCQGTIEEKIDEMLLSKQALSKEVLDGSGEAILTELSNAELIQLVSLDLKSVLE